MQWRLNRRRDKFLNWQFIPFAIDECHQPSGRVSGSAGRGSRGKRSCLSLVPGRILGAIDGSAKGQTYPAMSKIDREGVSSSIELEQG